MESAKATFRINFTGSNFSVVNAQACSARAIRVPTPWGYATPEIQPSLRFNLRFPTGPSFARVSFARFAASSAARAAIFARDRFSLRYLGVVVTISVPGHLMRPTRLAGNSNGNVCVDRQG